MRKKLRATSREQRVKREEPRGGGGVVEGYTSVCKRAVYLLLISVLAISGCGAEWRAPAVPENLADRAVLLNNPAIRTWDDQVSPEFLNEIYRMRDEVQAEVAALLARETPGSRAPGQPVQLPKSYMLGISGGGSYGAFGAGVLCGWTERGDRPSFVVVTGISTGALTAPFAFLGPAYDDRLRTVYTTVSTRDIVAWRGITSAIFGDAAFDTAPLRRLVERLIDEDVLREIAKEYDKGRVLVVGTCNLDADRGVVWNMGAIAKASTKGDPAALRLFHDVLMASAAIPGAFPPVMLDVEIDGQRFQEMHVDGGVRTQVFLYPPSFALLAESAARGFQRERAAYIIRNARQRPVWEQVTRRTMGVARRSISSMIQTQGIGDLFRIYLIAKRDKVDFNLAAIPEGFAYTSEDLFDPEFMSKLFDVGFRAASSAEGFPWQKSPPGWVDDLNSPAAQMPKAQVLPMQVPPVQVPSGGGTTGDGRAGAPDKGTQP
jgi:hypothetical protein